MAKKVKISSHLPGIHNVVTQGSIPHPTTSPYLNLHIRQKERERLLNEQERIRKRNRQIKQQLRVNNQVVKRLLKMATGKEWAKGASSISNPESSGRSPNKVPTLIEY